jgi:hypothetical protein
MMLSEEPLVAHDQQTGSPTVLAAVDISMPTDLHHMASDPDRVKSISEGLNGCEGLCPSRR